MTTRDPLSIVGSTIAEKYRIERLVGEGGFAVVYRAQPRSGTSRSRSSSSTACPRRPSTSANSSRIAFIQEGALLTELSSQTASIVQARDVGTYTSPVRPVDAVHGARVARRVGARRVARARARRGVGPWNIEQVVVLLSQAAKALDVAHGKGIAHRDIKPANMFVLGEQPRAVRQRLKVLDFGVAKMMTDNTQLKAAMAKTGMNVTSLHAPVRRARAVQPQLRRDGSVDGRVRARAGGRRNADAANRRCDGDDIVQLAFSSGNPERRPTPSTLGAPVSDAVEAVFAKALAINPHDRFARARSVWTRTRAGPWRLLTQPGYRPSLVGGEFASRPTHLMQGSTLAQPTGPSNIASTSSPATLNASPSPSNKTGAVRGVRCGCGGVGCGRSTAARWQARRRGAKKPKSPPRPLRLLLCRAIGVRSPRAQLPGRNGANPGRTILHGLGAKDRARQ